MKKVRSKWICDWCSSEIESNEEVPRFPHLNEEDTGLENDSVDDWVNIGTYEIGGECIKSYDICPQCYILFDKWISKLQSENGLPI